MDNRVKKLWTDALRSGEYPQGRQALRTENPTGYCCLGVLCDLYAKEFPTLGAWDGTMFTTPHIHTDECEHEDDVVEQESDYEESLLPEPVINWAGLYDGDPSMAGKLASEHNDGISSPLGGRTEMPPKSFAEIADLIEQYL